MKEYIDILTTDIDSNKVYNAYYTLYFMAQESLSELRLEPFEYYMSLPSTRMKFLNILNNIFTADEMGVELESAYVTLYPILLSYTFSSYNKYVYVPNNISASSLRDTHNPNDDELNILYQMMKYATAGYIKYNQGHIYQIELPNWSKHKGKSVQFEIKDNELPHLLGLTSITCGLSEWITTQLKNEYPNKVVNGRLPNVFIETNFLPYLFTHPKALRIVNRQVNKYVEKFKLKNPEFFDSKNDIKPKFLEEFQRKFRMDMGFSYPLIDYNRVLSRIINFQDLRTFSGMPEIIVDVDNSKTHDPLGCKTYLGVYRHSDIFASSGASSKDIILEKYSNDYLYKFGLDKNSNIDDSLCQKVTLYGLKQLSNTNDVTENTLVNNTATTLNRLLYKYRMAGKSYYVDKVEDTNSGEIVYLSDLESEIDYNASNMLARKNIKQVKKDTIQELDNFINHVNELELPLSKNIKFLEVIKEKRPSLLPNVLKAMKNKEEVNVVSKSA